MAEEINKAIEHILAIFPDADLESVSEAVARAASLVGENAFSVLLEEACIIFMDADEKFNSPKRLPSHDPPTSTHIQNRKNSDVKTFPSGSSSTPTFASTSTHIQERKPSDVEAYQSFLISTSLGASTQIQNISLPATDSSTSSSKHNHERDISGVETFPNSFTFADLSSSSSTPIQDRKISDVGTSPSGSSSIAQDPSTSAHISKRNMSDVETFPKCFTSTNPSTSTTLQKRKPSDIEIQAIVKCKSSDNTKLKWDKKNKETAPYGGERRHDTLMVGSSGMNDFTKDIITTCLMDQDSSRSRSASSTSQAQTDIDKSCKKSNVKDENCTGLNSSSFNPKPIADVDDDWGTFIDWLSSSPILTKTEMKTETTEKNNGTVSLCTLTRENAEKTIDQKNDPFMAALSTSAGKDYKETSELKNGPNAASPFALTGGDSKKTGKLKNDSDALSLFTFTGEDSKETAELKNSASVTSPTALTENSSQETVGEIYRTYFSPSLSSEENKHMKKENTTASSFTLRRKDSKENSAKKTSRPTSTASSFESARKERKIAENVNAVFTTSSPKVRDSKLIPEMKNSSSCFVTSSEGFKESSAEENSIFAASSPSKLNSSSDTFTRVGSKEGFPSMSVKVDSKDSPAKRNTTLTPSTSSFKPTGKERKIAVSEKGMFTASPSTLKDSKGGTSSSATEKEGSKVVLSSTLTRVDSMENSAIDSFKSTSEDRKAVENVNGETTPSSSTYTKKDSRKSAVKKTSAASSSSQTRKDSLESTEKKCSRPTASSSTPRKVKQETAEKINSSPRCPKNSIAQTTPAPTSYLTNTLSQHSKPFTTHSEFTKIMVPGGGYFVPLEYAASVFQGGINPSGPQSNSLSSPQTVDIENTFAGVPLSSKPGMVKTPSSVSYLKRSPETQTFCKIPEKQVKMQPSASSAYSDVFGAGHSNVCKVTPEIKTALSDTDDTGVSLSNLSSGSRIDIDVTDIHVICEVCAQSVSCSRTVECYSNHAICETCVKKEVSHVMNSEEKHQLLCPEKNCNGVLNLDSLTSLLDQFVLDLLKRDLKRKEEKISLLTIGSLDGVISCPTCSHEGLSSEGSLNFLCPSRKCQMSFCSYCMLEWKGKNKTQHLECEVLSNVGSKCLKDISKLPDSWKSYLEGSSKQHHEKSLVPLDSKLGKELITLFKAGRPRGQICKIQRIQNRKLWEKYVLKRKHLEEDLGLSCIKERVLFHGTHFIDSICNEGFDMRVQTANGRAMGKGIYFSTCSAYSQKYGTSSMFIARVLCGRSAAGHNTFTRPPADNAGRMFDSCTDNVAAPYNYIVFDNAQCYPEFLIEY